MHTHIQYLFLQFTPPSKRRRHSDSQEDDKKDPSYRGNKATSPLVSGQSDYFPASQLFEYQWPLGNSEADFFMLQEQVCFNYIPCSSEDVL